MKKLIKVAAAAAIVGAMALPMQSANAFWGPFDTWDAPWNNGGGPWGGGPWGGGPGYYGGGPWGGYPGYGYGGPWGGGYPGGYGYPRYAVPVAPPAPAPSN
ncbi:hypothetical protein BOW53_09540 [Solemya pervernicosa gill symbiont]|uniref:Sulfur globule protein CV1 n=2 Tax=Gammaproteobacteria incertae sedis TaxID=118884 RepID=A0A1T2L4I8_9GAMM|nr:hypothetical protein [Candidatus Reidiella endopervernicosa]OOZ39950.1 hypothetical protein BOW53_09540 [Solemya pervernicosa gill symbiont]QKQ25955.1 hypothetical protein HUE57_06405 [Candidatus Reidiella endopervernicosa]